MKLRVALQMDPLASIDPKKDATFLMGLEAQKRGYELWHYTPDKLSYYNGAITAQAQRITLHSGVTPHYEAQAAIRLPLHELDVILLRQNPPFDMSYITTTYLLEKLHPKPLVVNHPTYVRDYPEKLFPTLLTQFTPPTLITADIEEIKYFRKEYGDIVIKPLYGFSGHSVFHLKPEDPNFTSLMETLFATNKEPWVIQRFLPEMREGEHRILLVDGQYAGIAGRIPAKDETRASFHVGAQYIKATPNKRHQEICEALGPILKEKGMIFTGIDVIGDYLTEINITSPGSLIAMTQLYGKKLEEDIWDVIEKKL